MDFGVRILMWERSDSGDSYDLGVPAGRLTPEDHNLVCTLGSGYQEDLRSLQANDNPAHPKTRTPMTPAAVANWARMVPAGPCFRPETPEECLYALTSITDKVSKTFAAQEAAQVKIQVLDDRVEKHEKRIAELEGYVALASKKTKVAANRKRRAEEATGQGPSKRTAS